MAFHSYPETLIWDAYSGDYGPNFAGHVMGAATYLVEHPVFGWVSFGGNLVQRNGLLIVEPRDAARKRFFIAETALWVELDAGQIESFSFDPKSKEVVVQITSNFTGVTDATLKWEQTSRVRSSSLSVTSNRSTRVVSGQKIDIPSTVVFRTDQQEA